MQFLPSDFDEDFKRFAIPSWPGDRLRHRSPHRGSPCQEQGVGGEGVLRGRHPAVPDVCPAIQAQGMPFLPRLLSARTSIAKVASLWPVVLRSI